MRLRSIGVDFLTLRLASAAWLCLAGIAGGHGLDAPWANADALEGGLYIAVEHPRVIRRPAGFYLKVVVGNMATDGVVEWRDVHVRRLGPLDDKLSMSSFVVGRSLPMLADSLADFNEAMLGLETCDREEDRGCVDELVDRYRRRAQEMLGGVSTFRIPVDRQAIPDVQTGACTFDVDVRLYLHGVERIIRRRVVIPVMPDLPDGRGPYRPYRFDRANGTLQAESNVSPRGGGGDQVKWFSGDQHIHTTYSIDAAVREGTTEDVIGYGAAAELVGLDWIIITDHANVNANWFGTPYYTREQFELGTQQARAYTAEHDLLAMYSEEMGVGRIGFWSLPAHLLAYPYTSDSIGFIENPSSGLVFGHANCESEQTILDRLRDAGGFGFIAHAFDSFTLAFAKWDWDSGAVGWAGMEIWSDSLGQIKPVDVQSYDKWHELLQGIESPRGGRLAERPGYPNSFPVGIGNSDAHQPSRVGGTFTYAWMPTFTRENVVRAMMSGHCIASNGPLVSAEINNFRVGEVAMLLPLDNELEIVLTTTPEFGSAGEYAVTVFVDGRVDTIIPPTGEETSSAKITVRDFNLRPPSKFVTLRVDSSDGAFHAFTNPIWLQFTVLGDMDGDEVVSGADIEGLVDVLMDPTSSDAYARFAGDVNQNGVLNGEDVGAFVEMLPNP